ncbi:MAG: sigma-70 family RNA polymerase sigma factor [Anaerolineae bacterium]
MGTPSPRPDGNNPYAAMDEAELIERAARDPQAFGELYERYVDRIYNYIYHRVGHAQEAEDLTSRTFQRALQHIGRYEDHGAPFSAWLYRIAHNLVANWYRDTSRRKEIALDELYTSHRRSDDPYREVIRREEIETVRELVRQLSPDRQMVLILKHSEHLSNAEIAQVLGRTEGAIKSLYHRTLQTLREELEKRGIL